jgi:hypothetical protein
VYIDSFLRQTISYDDISLVKSFTLPPFNNFAVMHVPAILDLEHVCIGVT